MDTLEATATTVAWFHILRSCWGVWAGLAEAWGNVRPSVRGSQCWVLRCCPGASPPSVLCGNVLSNVSSQSVLLGVHPTVCSSSLLSGIERYSVLGYFRRVVYPSPLPRAYKFLGQGPHPPPWFSVYKYVVQKAYFKLPLHAMCCVGDRSAAVGVM